MRIHGKALLCLSWSADVVAQVADVVEGRRRSVDDLPSPTLDPVGCERPGRLKDGSFVCNPDKVLSLLGAQRIEDRLEAINKLQTPCEDSPQDIEAGVAVIARMQHSTNVVDAEERDDEQHRPSRTSNAEEFSNSVMDSWRVGKRGCDNGFLLFLSREDRSFAMSVGKGLEPYLSPRDRMVALDAMVPYLRDGDYDTAVLQGVVEVERRLQKALPRKASEETDAVTISSTSMHRRVRAEGEGSSDDALGGNDGGGGGIRQRALRVTTLALGMVPPKYRPLVVAPFIWGVLNRMSAAQRRRFQRFQDKLARIEEARATVPLIIAGGSRDATQVAAPRTCPVCLERFTVNGPGEKIEGRNSSSAAGAVQGSDGKDALVMHCGHGFCQKCLQRWRHDHGSYTDPDAGKGNADKDLCPICDDFTLDLGDPAETSLPGSRRKRRKLGFVELGWSNKDAGTRGSSFEDGSASSGTDAIAARRSTTVGRTLDGIPLTSISDVASFGVTAAGAAAAARRRVEDARTAKTERARATSMQDGVQGSYTKEALARRDVAFRLESLKAQYPRFLKEGTVNRWLFDDFASDWTQDPIIERLRPHTSPPAAKDSGVNGKLSSWVSRGSREDKSHPARKGYGGGSASSATGRSW